MTCGACHIAFNPIAPPADPVNPKWENLAGSIGNQYLREGRMFQGDMTPADFLWHMYEAQQPGTSDTSRLSLDWIDNPNTINGIYYLTSARPTHVETMNENIKELKKQAEEVKSKVKPEDLMDAFLANRPAVFRPDPMNPALGGVPLVPGF